MTLKSLIMCNVHVTHQILLQTLTHEPIQCSKNKPIFKESSLTAKSSIQFKKYLCTLALPLLHMCISILYLIEGSYIFFTKHAASVHKDAACLEDESGLWSRVDFCL